MNQRCLHLIVLFIVLVSAPITGLAKSDPKPKRQQVACVQCAVEDGCKTCVAGGSALRCRTFNCAACETSGTCNSGGGGAVDPGEGGGFSLDSRDKQSLRLSPVIIRDIGTRHPRFAVTLAEMTSYGISPGERHVYWAPVSLSSADVEPFLNKAAHSLFFERFDEQTRKLNRLIQKGELTDIIYHILVTRSDEGAWLIKMHVEGEVVISSGDPAYSALEIRIEPVHSSFQQESRNIITWHIR